MRLQLIFKIFLIVVIIIVSAVLANAKSYNFLDKISENQYCYYLDISSDGKYVVLNRYEESGTMTFQNVLLCDWKNKTFKLVNKSYMGFPSAYASTCSISGDGRYVAYASSSGSILQNDKNGVSDIFLYDSQSETNIRISVGYNGVESNGGSFNPKISEDGRYIVYESAADNLISKDTNALTDIFLYDRNTATTTRISVAADGTEADAYSASPSISANNSIITFTSRAGNLGPIDTNKMNDIYIYKLSNHQITKISNGISNTQSDGHSSTSSLSSDGRFVCFESTATNLIANDTNAQTDIFVYDSKDGSIERVSVSSTGEQANNLSIFSSISSDGRFVSFKSWASNLVGGDTNDWHDAFVYDRENGNIVRVSTGPNGEPGNGRVVAQKMAADASYIVFSTESTNWGPGFNTPVEVFVHDLYTDITIGTLKLNFINPSSAENTAPINAIMSGSGFKTGMQAKLIGLNNFEIPGTVKSVSADGKSANVTFDVTNKPVGVYNLQIANTDGEKYTGISFFTLAEEFFITDVTPTSAPNTGKVDVVVHGSGFIPNCIAKLTMPGKPDIVGENTLVIGTGNSLITKFDLEAVTPGVYKLECINPNGKFAKSPPVFMVDFNVIVYSIKPSEGGYNAPVTVQLVGRGFSEGMVVSLSKTGFNSIDGSPSKLGLYNESLETTFSLDDQISGVWDVNISSGDGHSAAIPNAFTIAKPNPDVKIKIDAPLQHRLSRGPISIWINAINDGNMDANGCIALSGIPLGIDWIITSPKSPLLNGKEIGWNKIVKSDILDGTQHLSIPDVKVPAKSTKQYCIKLDVKDEMIVQLKAVFVGK